MAKKEFCSFFQKIALKFIRTGSDSDMYDIVTDEALFLATAGYLKEANRILETLWSFKWPHSENCWLPDQSFEVLWAAAGKRPQSAPFPPKSLDEIELAHRHYMAGDSYLSLPLPDAPLLELHGFQLFRRCSQLACPIDQDMPSAKAELEALAGLAKFVSDEDSGSYQFFGACCLAAELSARNDQQEMAANYARLWARKYTEEEGGACNFSCMASNRHIVPMLLDGLLADELEVHPVAAKEYADKLIREASARMKQGRKLRYGKWTWKKFLKSISSRAIKLNKEIYPKEIIRSKWLGAAPASSDVIQAVEQKIGDRLPSDYREFLLSSNGFMMPSRMIPGLLPVEDIGRFKDLQKIPVMMEILQEGVPGNPEVRLDDSIQISHPGEWGGELVFLVPPQSKEERWQTCFFEASIQSWSLHPSFRHFMERVYMDLEGE